MRQAILDANANAGVQDTIAFAIGSGTQIIAPTSALPTITDPVIIDGSTQPGFAGSPLIVLNGANVPPPTAGATVDGLLITAGGSVVQSLVINNYSNSGIELKSGGGNLIVGNYLGTNAAGNTPQGNGNAGININNSANNTIGGTTPAERNLISGNGSGVALNNCGATGNLIEGNFIGTNASGTGGLGNSSGILMTNAPANTIGGTAAGAGNVISASTNGFGISLSGGDNNFIQGNLIGTDVTGSVALGNRYGGIQLGSSFNTVGGTTAAARNVISASQGIFQAGTGILIAGPFGNDNLIEGNYIGTNAAGTAALGNATQGIYISISSRNTIGGSTPGAGNVISGNGQTGIQISGYNGTADSNVIRGNRIGTNAAGTAPLANGYSGISVGNASSTTIGGTVSGAGNLISGNTYDGITTDNSGTVIQGNFIGTDITGTVKLPNRINGIDALDTGTTIGGTTAGAGNLISGNFGSGIVIGVNGSSGGGGTVVAGNLVGTDASGVNPLGNAGYGIVITRGAEKVIVGGTDAGAGNVIAFNGLVGGYAGVLVGSDSNLQLTPDAASGNSLLSNSIYGNGGIGIDLGQADGPTLNDSGDADTGPNDLQNYPVLGSVAATPSGAIITGTLNSTPGSTFTLQFFASTAADPSGYGQGQIYLGSVLVMTDAGGNATFSAACTTPLPSNQRCWITATATNANGSTSEFSHWFEVLNLTATTSTVQTTAVSSAFPGPFQVILKNNAGTPVGAGINVTFTVSGNSLGSGATYAGGLRTVTVTTDANGMATAPILTANGITGTYLLTVSTASVSFPVTFTLTNTPAGLPFTDTFAPPQSALTAAGWQVLGGAFAQNGTSAVAGAAANNFAVYRNGSSADMSVVAQNVSVVGGGTVGLIARLTGPAGYLATLNNVGGSGVVTLFELTPTAFVKLTSVNVAPFTQPLTLRFDVVGISLRVFINNVLTASILNTAVSGPGQAGIYGTPGEALGTFTAAAAVPALPSGDGFAPDQPALSLSTWQPLQGSFSQSNGRAVAGSGTNNFAVDVNASAADVSISAQNVSVIGGGTVGLLARLVAPGGYLATLNNVGGKGVITLFEVTAAAYIKLTSVNVPLFTQAVTMRFDVIGNSLQVFINGILDVSFLNSDLTGPGLVGLYGTAGETLGTFTASATVPTLPFSDSFSPAQSTLTGANWKAQSGGFSQNGTQAVASGAALNLATYNHGSVADVRVSAQNVAIVNGGTVGLVARYTSASSYYLATISNSGPHGVVTIFQSTPSGFQVLASATMTPFTAPVTLSFIVQGNTLQALVNGTVVSSVSNSALTGPGLVGLWGTSNELFGTFTASAS